MCNGSHQSQEASIESTIASQSQKEQPHSLGEDGGEQAMSKKSDPEPSFPWHLGIYDSHCHPTDTMHAIPALQDMKARILTVMATRFQDQDLVAQVAAEYEYVYKSVEEQDSSSPARGARVIPSFGYHPWFSHLIYNDLDNEQLDAGPLDKSAHYNNVLTSGPIDESLIASLPAPTPLSQILSQTRANLLARPQALLGEVGLDRTFRIPHGASWRSDDDPQNMKSNPGSSLSSHDQSSKVPDSGSATIDRAAGLTPGTHHTHALTRHRVKPAHQVRVLQEQLKLAGALARPASVHVVGGQGAALEALSILWKGLERKIQSSRERKMIGRSKRNRVSHGETGLEVENESDSDGENSSKMAENKLKPFPPRICLHSFSGPAETVGQYLQPSIPVDFYFSFSEAINFSLPAHQQRGHSTVEEEELDPASARALAALKAVPEDRLLIESDLHICGERMDSLLEDIVRRVCKARNWTLEHGVQTLARNWHRFVYGDESKL